MDKKELTKIVSSMILGDGCLRTWKNVKNSAYSISQISVHRDYISWQEEILSSICKVKIYDYKAYQDKNGVNHQDFLKLETLSHPFFTTLRERLYHDGRKTVSIHDLKLFDAQSAALWYMDDGYLLKAEDKYNRNNVYLCTDHYNEAEITMLQKVLYEKLLIPFDIKKRGYKKDGTRIYRLFAKKDNAKKFIDLVSPYIFPSFEHKITLYEN